MGKAYGGVLFYLVFRAAFDVFRSFQRGRFLGVFVGFWFGGDGGCFADDFGRFLVFAEAEEGSLADEVFRGPGGEANLGDEGGLDPGCAAAGIGGDAVEGGGRRPLS